jgi:hypothetical protein
MINSNLALRDDMPTLIRVKFSVMKRKDVIVVGEDEIFGIHHISPENKEEKYILIKCLGSEACTEVTDAAATTARLLW